MPSPYLFNEDPSFRLALLPVRVYSQSHFHSRSVNLLIPETFRFRKFSANSHTQKVWPNLRGGEFFAQSPSGKFLRTEF